MDLKKFLKIFLSLMTITIVIVIVFAVKDYIKNKNLPDYLKEEVDFDKNNYQERLKYIKDFESKGDQYIDENLLEREL